MDNPIRKEPTELGKNFETQTQFAKNSAQFNINEVDKALNEKQESLKKKIFRLDKMESLVHTDPKLSAIYADMSEDGEEKYGYHHNETIMNIIFNDYVLNDTMFLQKYKRAIPKEKKRRDKAGINKLKHDLNPEKDEKNEVKTHGNFAVIDGFGYDQERDGTMEIERKYEVDETTSAGGAPMVGGGTINSTGAFETKLGYKSGKRDSVLDKPLWSGGTVVENYITDPKLFKMIFESLDMSEHHLNTREEKVEYIKNNIDNLTDEVLGLFYAGIESLESDLDNSNDMEVDDNINEANQGVSNLKSSEVMELANAVDSSVNPTSVVNKFIEARIDLKVDITEYGNSLLFAYQNIYQQVKKLIDSQRYQDGSEEYFKLYDLFLILDEGIGEMKKKGGVTSPEVYSNVGGSIGESTSESNDDPCWDDYTQYGMKTKDGEEVPNCVEEDMNEAVDSSGVREFAGDKSGEEPFEIGGQRWQYCWVYDGDKRDDGVYNLDQDISYSFDWFRENVLGGMNENPIVGAVARGVGIGAGSSIANKLMGEDDVNEVSYNTFAGASTKMQRSYNQYGRSQKLSDTYFRQYSGKDFIGGKIGQISHSNSNGSDESIVISIDKVNPDIKIGAGWIKYLPQEDQWKTENGDIDHSLELTRNESRILSKIAMDVNPNTKYKQINGNFNLSVKESIIGQDPTSMAREREGGVVSMTESEDINEDGFCRADEKPVMGKHKGEEGACQKKEKQKDKLMKGSGDHNLKQRKKREAEDQKRRENQFKYSTKKKSDNKDAQNEDYNMELQECENQMNKLKDMLFEERKPSSMVNVERIGKENEKYRKQDIANSALGDLVDTGEMAVDQYEEVKDPQKMSADLEKSSVKDSLENVGNSANEDGKEIPKRNYTEDEKEYVDVTRVGMEDWNYDNKPDKRFEDRMKADMGEDIYKLRQEKMKHKENAPMYNKDTTPVDDGDKKDQYNKFKNESYISGKYRDGLNRTRIANFKLSDTEIVNGVNENAVPITTDGMGNTYTQNVDESVTMRSIIDSFKFYMQSGTVVAVKNKQGLLNESKISKETSIDIEKLKRLSNYNPNDAMGTKKNRFIK